MNLILVPGFWLDGSSWSRVVPKLEAAGHRARPLTLPGLESATVDRSGIRLRDHVDAVVGAVDELDDPIVLIGHSGGGAIAQAAADLRADRIARVIYVDCVPLGPGQAINAQLPVVGGEIPLPDWSEFDEEDLRDLDAELRAAFRSRAIPEPAAVARDPQVLTNERRFEIPISIIASEFTDRQIHAAIEQGDPEIAELMAVRDVEYIRLRTGHWPQFTMPEELAKSILAAIARTTTGLK